MELQNYRYIGIERGRLDERQRRTYLESSKKCKLESAFWKLTKVFPSTEGMVSVLYRRQEQEEQIQKIWCKRIGIAVLLLIAFLFLCYMEGRTSPPEKAIQNGNVIFREGEGKDITFNLSTQVDGEKKAGNDVDIVGRQRVQQGRIFKTG